MIYVNHQYFKAFSSDGKDQSSVCLFTVLHVNEEYNDCAAYQGVGPPHESSYYLYPALIEEIQNWGNKIREGPARAMFPEIKEQNLKYRR